MAAGNIEEVYGPGFFTAAPDCRWVRQSIPTAPLSPYYTLGGGVEGGCAPQWALSAPPMAPWAVAMPGSQIMTTQSHDPRGMRIVGAPPAGAYGYQHGVGAGAVAKY
jgi:hypothetical protein